MSTSMYINCFKKIEITSSKIKVTLKVTSWVKLQLTGEMISTSFCSSTKFPLNDYNASRCHPDGSTSKLQRRFLFISPKSSQSGWNVVMLSILFARSLKLHYFSIHKSTPKKINRWLVNEISNYYIILP